MKRICIILLALVLALCCVPALAAEGDAILGQGGEEALYFNYSFAIGDTLYLVDYDTVYTYHIGDSDFQPYTFELVGLDDGSYDIVTMPFEADG